MNIRKCDPTQYLAVGVPVFPLWYSIYSEEGWENTIDGCVVVECEQKLIHLVLSRIAATLDVLLTEMHWDKHSSFHELVNRIARALSDSQQQDW